MNALLYCAALLPQDPPRLPTVVVEGRGDTLVGTATSASEGITGSQELERRPLLRGAELLETVPGVIATQHSGAGKANQLFARGFNLDHGTDLRTSLFGMPLNLPTHAHGQGYTDLNLVIPELVDTVRWRLGPYDVRDGDFSSAGAVDIDYVRTLPEGFLKVSAGSYGFARTVLADSMRVGDGHLLLALELLQDDGRFAVDQDYAKRNGYASWATEDLRISLFAHSASWTATDQIPARAVSSGQLSRFDSLDASDGGETDHYGAVVAWTPVFADGEASVRGYGFGYGLDLWSNFTYALADPSNGDQFEQRDRRSAFGLHASRTWSHGLGGHEGTFTLGAEVRSDTIADGLFASAARRRLATVRSDDVRQLSLAAFAESREVWTDWLRTTVGVRGDFYRFDVDSDREVNSGRSDAGILSSKAGLALGPWRDTEIYGNVGTGFHSNDARGTTIREDPTTPAPLDAAAVSPLVRSRGAEIGVRSTAIAGLQSTLALWVLEVDSELVFVGDAGSSEPSRASRRHGLELANFYRPVPWLALDADLSLARARFRDADPGGDHVPGALPVTLAVGATIDWSQDWSTSLRVRHLGRRALVEDRSVRSQPTTLVNARAQWRLDDRRELAIDVLNLLDSKDNDIEYFYASQLPGEANPVDDVHFHPVEPLALRISFTARF